MLKEQDYVSVELAKKLKAAGFKEKVENYFNLHPPIGTRPTLFAGYGNYNIPEFDGQTLSGPTLYEAMIWLVDKGIIIGIDYMGSDYGYVYNIVDFYGYADEEPQPDEEAYHETYQEALAAGIDSALTCIINSLPQ